MNKPMVAMTGLLSRSSAAPIAALMAPREARGATAAPLGAERERETAGAAVFWSVSGREECPPKPRRKAGRGQNCGGLPANTLYVSTGGGWGPASIDALRALAAARGVELVAATDRNAQGERYAQRLAGLAAEAGCAFSRLAPELDDWNDQLRAARPTVSIRRIGETNSRET
jgi:hypothetical protein